MHAHLLYMELLFAHSNKYAYYIHKYSLHLAKKHNMVSGIKSLKQTDISIVSNEQT